MGGKHLRCMNTAMVAREKMTALLQDVGLLNRAATDVVVGLPSAAEIRAAIESARLEPHEVIRDGAPALRPGDGASLSLPAELPVGR